ncbi:hypothetical protein AF332_20710 [Sporosarcina globispora]|uniref:dUTPase n=1 Tax=Sporosarcina globispora TaxID=1459 RepID=A0A0M0GGK0_SPOGL|nr:dUTP diphosphatase [Sporosarcina globispora]KON88969.1 hypothetical protein AF332_20710 [Sporosarcina globispora]
MNLSNLFEKQLLLREKIINKHNLQEQDLIPGLILAFQVELGELANEQRSWKHWSNDRKPRIEAYVECSACNGTGDLNYEMVQEDAEGNGDHEYIDCPDCDCSGFSGTRNPLLEEYVDGLSFILEIGSELSEECLIDEDYPTYWITTDDTQSIIEQFQTVYREIADFSRDYDVMTYSELVSQYLGLGKMLGFSWIEIEQAYHSKHQINLQRQEEGY